MSKTKEVPTIQLNDAEEQQKFDEELAWCLSKITNGLANEKDSRKSNILLNNLMDFD